MIKELILAIALGALLGFGVTGGYYAFSKKNNSELTKSSVIVSAIPTISSTASAPTTSPAANNNSGSADSSTNNGTQSHDIKIDSPQDNDVSSSSKITIKGSTSPNSYLVITTPSHIFNDKADNAGNFAVDIELDSGANLINVESIDTNDDQTKTSLMVTYSTAKI